MLSVAKDLYYDTVRRSIGLRCFLTVLILRCSSRWNFRVYDREPQAAILQSVALLRPKACYVCCILMQKSVKQCLLHDAVDEAVMLCPTKFYWTVLHHASLCCHRCNILSQSALRYITMTFPCLHGKLCWNYVVALPLHHGRTRSVVEWGAAPHSCQMTLRYAMPASESTKQIKRYCTVPLLSILLLI